MVVCQCRKATKLYCFVHKVAVCGECICLPEHQICVVRTYSEWVIDGEYDWPLTCSLCNLSIGDGNDPKTTRLGCLHLLHTNCLVTYLQNRSSKTAPAGYTCPACSSPIWPPKSIKDTGSCLHSKLKEAIIQSGLEKTIFGNHLVTLRPPENSIAPPAFASDPLIRLSSVDDGSNKYDPVRESSLPSSSENKEYGSDAYGHRSLLSDPDIIKIENPSSVENQYLPDQDLKNASPAVPGATTRKGAYHVERQNSEISYYADDEDGNQKKYTRRGPLRHKVLRLLLPFWSNSLPTLPVTAPPRKDGALDDIPEGRPRRHKSSRMDPRKILLIMAIMACMATMAILYYRLAQRSIGGSITNDEPQ